MRGDLCPYDHGIDPVVLEDVPLSRVLTSAFGTTGAPGPGGAVPVGAAVPEAGAPPTGAPGAGPNGNAPLQHLPLASLPPPHLRNQHHANMGSSFSLSPFFIFEHFFLCFCFDFVFFFQFGAFLKMFNIYFKNFCVCACDSVLNCFLKLSKTIFNNLQ